MGVTVGVKVGARVKVGVAVGRVRRGLLQATRTVIVRPASKGEINFDFDGAIDKIIPINDRRFLAHKKDIRPALLNKKDPFSKENGSFWLRGVV
jgi:hypothetical protein